MPVTKKATNTKDNALVRVSHLAAVKGVPLTGDEALALAEFYINEPQAERRIIRAAQIANTKGVKLNGGELLRIAKFLP